MVKLKGKDYKPEEIIGSFNLQGWDKDFYIYNVFLNHMGEAHIDVTDIHCWYNTARTHKLYSNTKGVYFNFEKKKIYVKEITWLHELDFDIVLNKAIEIFREYYPYYKLKEIE